MHTRISLRLLLLAFTLEGFACSDDGGSSNIDGGGGGTVDANPSAPDARVGPDAMPNTTMSFFVTSVGNGAQGGNLGGLGGADSKCQALAGAAGGGARTWRAYLSTDNPVVHAKDRIGTGPWFNQAGVMVATNLTTLHQGVAGLLILTEQGDVVPADPLDHDILTGSTSDGSLMVDKTCDNWTNSTDSFGAQVGHADIAPEDLGGESWNSQHDPQCSREGLASTAGTGRIYCFAIN